MNKEILKRIYEVMADKTLSFGCRIEIDWGNMFFNSVIINSEHTENWNIKYETRHPLYYFLDSTKDIFIERWELKIIGHPVMIGDVWNYAEKNDVKQVLIDWIDWDDCWNLFESNNNYLTSVWKDKRKPIEDQSQKCINFVESLISKPKKNFW